MCQKKVQIQLFPTILDIFENLFKPETLSLKPHQSSDSSWQAIQSLVFRQKMRLGFRDFSLVCQIGSGDIGRVFLCYLRRGSGGFYTMKVVDREVLAVKKKIQRAEMEKKILNMLDHPFLPTLYTEFEAFNFSCVVMEYYSGGDLHYLRHKQPYKHLSYVLICKCHVYFSSAKVYF